MKTTYSYTLFIKGIFGRNRSVKFESFDFAIDQAEPMPDYLATLAGMAKLREIKPKGPHWFKIEERKWTHDGAFKSTDLTGDSRAIHEERRAS